MNSMLSFFLCVLIFEEDDYWKNLSKFQRYRRAIDKPDLKKVSRGIIALNNTDLTDLELRSQSSKS